MGDKPPCMLALYPITCSHCAGVFQGSYQQQHRVKKYAARAYCSTACRLAAISKLFSTPVPQRGPCQHCGKMFASRRESMFCDLACYIASDRFKEVRNDALAKASTPEAVAKQSAARRKGGMVPCLECGTEFYRKKMFAGSRKRLFCARPCYRTYLAARYDRWIANPQEMSLPQAYDEFLDQYELPCLIQGCDWRGVHLSGHVNIAHGLTAREFKRAAGFNLSSGLVGSDLARRLTERANVGVASRTPPFDVEEAKRLSLAAVMAPDYVAYVSLEGSEHRAKSGIFTRLLQGPDRACQGCGKTFTQSSPMGFTKYCSTPCRSRYYYAKAKLSKKLPDASVSTQGTT